MGYSVTSNTKTWKEKLFHQLKIIWAICGGISAFLLTCLQILSPPNLTTQCKILIILTLPAISVLCTLSIVVVTIIKQKTLKKKSNL